MKIKWIVGFLCTFLVAVSIFLFFRYFEYVEEEVDLGMGIKARKNPYLAAQYFLSEYGVQVESDNRHRPLNELGDYDVIYVSSSAHLPTERRIQSLISFADAGGHVVVSVDSNRDLDSDPFLARFELTLQETECQCETGDLDAVDLINDFANDDHSDEEKPEKKLSEILIERNNEIERENANKAKFEAEAEGESESGAIPPEQISTLVFTDIEFPVEVNFNSNYSLSHPYFYMDDSAEFEGFQPFYWDGDDYGIYFVQFYIGDGILSVISDNTIFQNNRIGNYDHAYFLRVLMGYNDSVYILYGINMPSLVSLLREYLSEFFVAFFTLIFLWIFQQSRRFGPVRIESQTLRRSLREHLLASAYFLWRGSWMEKLYKPIREEIYSKAQQHFHHFDYFNEQTKVSNLSIITSIPEEQIRRALFSKFSASEQEFIHNIQVLKEINNRL